MRTRAATRAQGFTLLELIVTIVVVGVLAALALPTFSAVVGRARDGCLVATLSSTLRVANAIATLPWPGDGTPGNSEARLAGWPALSADSRCVVFESAATSLVTGDTAGVADYFVRRL